MLWGRDFRSALTRVKVLGLALVVVVAAASVTASADVYLPEPTEVSFRTAFTPSRLPAHETAPVSLAFRQTIGNRDGSHPPPLRELQVGLDRHLSLSVKGLPVCPGPLNESGPRTGCPAVCKDAKVGGGTLGVEVALPEQQPVRISGRLIVYNGGFGAGRTKFWLYAYLPAPVTGAILMPLKIRRGGHGLYGWTGELQIPKIANGAGSITYLGARFRKGIFAARCPTGTSKGLGIARFVNGMKVQSLSTQTCRTSSVSG